MISDSRFAIHISMAIFIPVQETNTRHKEYQNTMSLQFGKNLSFKSSCNLLNQRHILTSALFLMMERYLLNNK